MLTADHVRLRRYKGELRLQKLPDATVLDDAAAVLVQTAREMIGEARADLDKALALEVGAKAQLLARGLKKLVLDKCVFEEPSGEPPETLRNALFLQASQRWQHDDEMPLRDRCLEETAEKFSLSAAELDEQLFADLKEAQRLTSLELSSANELVEIYELGRAQAVLLKARELRAEITCDDAATLRAVFRALRFHGLLFRAETHGAGAKLTLDGPFSLFNQSTRYGLRLALALGVLAACDTCVIDADVLWGRDRREGLFRWSSDELRIRPPAPTASTRDEVRTLLVALRETESAFDLDEGATLLDLGGQEICIPDLALVHRDSGEIVYLEVLGFWSRDAVWRRVELVERGLVQEKVIFAYSQRLRVSEAALDDDARCLLSFKGTLRASAVLDAAVRLIRA